jgi:hypothetical protein
MKKQYQQWQDSPRSLALHELLDLGLRCREPHDQSLERKFLELAVRLTPALVARLRVLEDENAELRSRARESA